MDELPCKVHHQRAQGQLKTGHRSRVELHERCTPTVDPGQCQKHQHQVAARGSY